jgi:hypothetical protein
MVPKQRTLYVSVAFEGLCAALRLEVRESEDGTGDAKRTGEGEQRGRAHIDLARVVLDLERQLLTVAQRLGDW